MKKICYLLFFFFLTSNLWSQNQPKLYGCEMDGAAFKAKYADFINIADEVREFSIRSTHSKKCQRIEYFDELLIFKNLVTLHFTYCDNLEEIPKSITKFKYLSTLVFLNSAISLENHLFVLKKMKALKNLKIRFDQEVTSSKKMIAFLGNMDYIFFDIHTAKPEITYCKPELQKLFKILAKTKKLRSVEIRVGILRKEYLEGIENLKHIEEIIIQGAFKNEDFAEITALYPNLKLMGGGIDKPEVTVEILKKEAEATDKRRILALKKRKEAARVKAKAAAERKHKEAMTRSAEKKRSEAAALGGLLGGEKLSRGSQGKADGDPYNGNLSNFFMQEPIISELSDNRKFTAPNIVKTGNRTLGIINIKICINQDGEVISALYTMKGSTTNDSTLKAKAVGHAKKYKFEKSDLEKEWRVIRYEFK